MTLELEMAEEALAVLDKLNPSEYKEYDLASQQRELDYVKTAMGTMNRVIVGLDRIILSHKITPEHLEAEQAQSYKDVLKEATTRLQRQATVLQSLIRM